MIRVVGEKVKDLCGERRGHRAWRRLFPGTRWERANKNPVGRSPRGFWHEHQPYGWCSSKNLAVPTFALVGTIIGLESLTTVFGMGTGVAFPVCSPEEARRTGRHGALNLVVARVVQGRAPAVRLAPTLPSKNVSSFEHQPDGVVLAESV